MKRFGTIFVVSLVLAACPTEMASSTVKAQRPSAIPVFSRVLDRNVTPTFPDHETEKRKLAVLSQGVLPNPVSTGNRIHATLRRP